VIPELVGAVSGCIVCQNALDHCEDALAILDVLASYAAPGCYFLLWTDIWHLHGVDAGHRNITRSAHAMDCVLRGFGFDIMGETATVRPPGECIEYGRLARKRAA